MPFWDLCAQLGPPVTESRLRLKKRRKEKKERDGKKEKAKRAKASEAFKRKASWNRTTHVKNFLRAPGGESREVLVE